MRGENIQKALKKRSQVKAVLAIAIMLSAGALIAIEIDDRTTDTSDAVMGWDDIAIIIIFTILIAATAYEAGLQAQHPESGIAQADRQGEANLVAASIAQGIGDQTNFTSNINTILNLTREHFVRYAELAASFIWGPNATYSADDILSQSGAYQNAAVAIANSSVQVSGLLNKVGERLTTWNTTTTTNIYKNNMTVSWLYGSTAFGSNSAFNGFLTSTTIASAGHDTVWISDVQSLWVFGGNATIKGSDGHVVTLSQGENDITSGFTPGLYTLQDGLTYAGPMNHVIDSTAATLAPGIVMTAGAQTKLATYDPTNKVVKVDGQNYSTLKIRVQPSDGTAQDTDVMPMLANLLSIMSTINSVLVYANSAASAVWDLFDRMGAASTFLTTLVVPDNYNNIDINQGQKELLTGIAMLQFGQMLSSDKSTIQATDFQLSSDSLTLFCRGDIYDNNGELLYKNVIFTPLFYNHETTLTTGNNSIDQPAVIAIWGSDQLLSSWNFTSNTTSAGAPPLTQGSSIYIYEMKLGNNFVNSAPLEVRHIDFIKASDWVWPTPPVPPTPPGNSYLIQYILIILGLILVVAGLIVRPLRPIMYIGFLLIGVGVIWVVTEMLIGSFSLSHLFGLTMGGTHELQ